MAMKQYLPDEKGMIKYSKNDGHTPSDSLNEIIDNARDKGASEIHFEVISLNKKNYLTAFNNGSPVYNEEQWDKLLKHANPGPHKENDIGNYGVGLKQFLSNFPHHSIFSKNKGKVEFRVKIDYSNYPEKFKHIEKKDSKDFFYEDAERDLPSEYQQLPTAAQNILKAHRQGFLIMVELTPEIKTLWENIETYEKSAEAYVDCKDIHIFLNKNKIVKKNPFGETKTKETISFREFPGVRLKYVTAVGKSKVHDKQGTYMKFNNRLINTHGFGKYWKKHAEKNGHILILEIDSWKNELLVNGSIKMRHQKNDYEINTNSPFFSAFNQHVTRIDKAIETSQTKAKAIKAQVKTKPVFKDLPSPKGLIKEAPGRFVNKSGDLKVVELQKRDIDPYLKAELGPKKTLEAYFGSEHRFNEVRYQKDKGSLVLAIRLAVKSEKVATELKSLFYEVDVLQDFARDTDLKCELRVVLPKDAKGEEVSRIKSRLEKKGVKFHS